MPDQEKQVDEEEKQENDKTFFIKHTENWCDMHTIFLTLNEKVFMYIFFFEN